MTTTPYVVDGVTEINAAQQNSTAAHAVQDYATTTARSASSFTPFEGMVTAITGSDRLEVYDGATWQRGPHYGTGGRTGGRWRRAAVQAIASATTATISFDTEDADSDGYLTPTSGTFTIPAGLGGLYLATFTIDAASTPTPARIGIEYVRSGTTQHVFTEIGSSSIPTGDLMGVTAMMPLSAADTFQCIVRNGAAGSINFLAWLDLIRVAI